MESGITKHLIIPAQVPFLPPAFSKSSSLCLPDEPDNANKPQLHPPACVPWTLCGLRLPVLRHHAAAHSLPPALTAPRAATWVHPDERQGERA
eukprot:1155629-Pelagomonas_calceolata.AAC.2